MANFYNVMRIRTSRRYALDVNDDYDTNPNKIYPVFLFTPDMNDTDNHYHIPLTPQQAEKLRDWLTKYLARRKKGGK